jgi:curved DNA-binding protein CbpA
MAHDSRGYYKLLNLEPGSGIEEVNLAYGFLKYESEKDGKTPDRKTQEAYACLSDPGRKAVYDTRRGDVEATARKQMTGYGVLLVILFGFAAFIFPGFLKPAPGPFHSGDRLVRSSNGSYLGEVVRREQFHKFPEEKVGTGYLVRLQDGEERWYPGSDLERHFHK